MGLRRMSHTGFTVSDMERSLAFYRDLLGMKVVAQQVGAADYVGRMTGFPGVAIKIAFLKADEESEHLLELLEYVSHPGEPTARETNRPGNGHICVIVDDIQALYERLQQAGVVSQSEPVAVTAGVNAGTWAVYVRDPDGFTVELHQQPPGRSAG